MTIIKIAGIAIIGAVAAIVAKNQKSDIAPMISLTCAMIILYYAVSSLLPVVTYIEKLSESNSFSEYYKIILKAVGIGLVAQVASDYCRDTGENAIAGKVEFAARIFILILGLPVINDLLKLAADILKT